MIGEFATSIRPKGFLTVTYRLQGANSDVATPSPADPIEQIIRLGQLRDAGLITDDEFDNKKADLLQRM
jgi:hypothetical protein